MLRSDLIKGADGVVSLRDVEKCILKHHPGLTTPSALSKDAFGDIFWTARPPLLFKEGNTFFHAHNVRAELVPHHGRS